MALAYPSTGDGTTSRGSEPVRTAEVIAAACLATDLGMGFPFEHGLHGTLMAMKLVDLLDVDRETESQTYYASLLMYSGCTTDLDIATGIFGGSRTRSIIPVQFGSVSEALGGILRSLPPPTFRPTGGPTRPPSGWFRPGDSRDHISEHCARSPR